MMVDVRPMPVEALVEAPNETPNETPPARGRNGRERLPCAGR
ncbi:hypothetical protein [Marilutibacter maris]|nr:hypothetical protein [Lysobacter maris]